ncbi:MAG: sigma-70 family RNA polymerase sigma factor [Gammaproteobacteria bacterium]
MDDDALWQLYREGDQSAFDEVYARHRGGLFRYVKRQCGDCPEAEELYQDVWMQAIRNRDSFQGGKLGAWLYRIARNRLIDHFRARGGGNKDLDEGDAEVVELHRDWPRQLLMLRDCVERLFGLLTGLSAAQRDAFLLKEEGGFTLEEIARITGCGRETVKSRLRYALTRLRKGLEDCEETS